MTENYVSTADIPDYPTYYLIGCKQLIVTGDGI